MKTQLFALVISVSGTIVATVPNAGCGTGDFTGETVSVDVGAGGKADDLIEIKVSAPGLTLWMRPVAERRTGAAEPPATWVFRGRVSKNLESVSSFVFDDAFGQATITGDRTFEIAFDGGSEINSLESGTRLFIAIDVVDSDTAYTASFLTGPHLTRFSGDDALFVSAPILPVHVGGLVYRGRADTETAGGLLSATSPEGPAPAVAPRAPKQWNLDFDFAALSATAAASVELTYVPASGTALHVQAGVDFALTELGITVEDPHTEWPEQTSCTADIQTCIDGLPPGSIDTEPCGSYRDVLACNLPAGLPGLGDAADDNTALEAVIADATAQLPDGKKIEFENLFVQSTGTATPTLAEVIDAYDLFAGLQGLEDLGEGDEAEVAGGLKTFHADAGIDAARQVVFDDDFVVGKMFHVSEPAPSALQWVTFYLLYFPDAGRVVVFHLITFET